MLVRQHSLPVDFAVLNPSPKFSCTIHLIFNLTDFYASKCRENSLIFRCLIKNCTVQFQKGLHECFRPANGQLCPYIALTKERVRQRAVTPSPRLTNTAGAFQYFGSLPVKISALNNLANGI